MPPLWSIYPGLLMKEIADHGGGGGFYTVNSENVSSWEPRNREIFGFNSV